MDFASFLFIFIIGTLFVGTQTSWYMQKRYKMAVIFAVAQLVSATIALEYFHLTLQQLLWVMLGYYAIAMFSTLYRIRIRIKQALLVKV